MVAAELVGGWDVERSGEACDWEEVSGDGNTQSRKQQKAIQ